MSAPGLIIAAPATGSGKTTVTLGLLRAFRRRGVQVVSAKAGPDYIDPRYHEAASDSACINLDGWAMRPDMLAGLAADIAGRGELVIAEGVMGLFDGGALAGHLGHGSTADLARELGWPVLLVVDVSGIGQSVAALVHGFCSFDESVEMGGIILNKVAGVRHEKILKAALECVDVPILGALPRTVKTSLPSRHLGLVQAGEHAGLGEFIDEAAQLAAAHIDLDAVQKMARCSRARASGDIAIIAPPGQRIAVARDMAFGFCYPHLLQGWARAGAQISFFSPLEDEAPGADADAVYLPGGYPELHGGRLAANEIFMGGLRAAAVSGARIFGECGGYMVLGEGLVDATGGRHEMAGLLALETSFARRRLHLGYRRLKALGGFAGCRSGDCFRAHEFHYASIVHEGDDAPLFELDNGDVAGLRRANVAGSFMHLIDIDAEG